MKDLQRLTVDIRVCNADYSTYSQGQLDIDIPEKLDLVSLDALIDNAISIARLKFKVDYMQRQGENTTNS